MTEMDLWQCTEQLEAVVTAGLEDADELEAMRRWVGSIRDSILDGIEGGVALGLARAQATEIVVREIREAWLRVLAAKEEQTLAEATDPEERAEIIEHGALLRAAFESLRLPPAPEQRH